MIDAVKSVVVETKLKSNGSPAGGNSPRQNESRIDCSPGKWYMRHRDLKRKHKELEKMFANPLKPPFHCLNSKDKIAKKAVYLWSL